MQGPVIKSGASALQFRQKIQQMIVGFEGCDAGTAAVADRSGQADLIQPPLHGSEALIQISGLHGMHQPKPNK